MWVEYWTSTQQPYVEILGVIRSLDGEQLLNRVQTQAKTRFEKWGAREMIGIWDDELAKVRSLRCQYSHLAIDNAEDERSRNPG